MPLLSNEKHEEFAKGLANGLRQIDAYTNAGYAGNPSAASQIAARPEVRERVAELRAERVERERNSKQNIGEEEGVGAIDRDWVIRELKKNVSEAQSGGNISAANKAIEMLIDVLDIKPKTPKGGKDKDKDAAKEVADPDHGGEKFDAILSRLDALGAPAEPAEG